MCFIFFFSKRNKHQIIAKKKGEKKMVKCGVKEENSEEFLDSQTPFGERKRLSSMLHLCCFLAYLFSLQQKMFIATKKIVAIILESLQ